MYTKLEGLCLSETSKPYHVRFIQLSILTHVRGFKGMYRCCGFRVTSHTANILHVEITSKTCVPLFTCFMHVHRTVIACHS